MKLYSDFPARRTAQITADVIALVIATVAIVAAVLVYNVIVAFAEVGRQVQDAGGGFRDTMSDAGDTLGGVPLIGSGIRGPFDSASEAGASLADAGSGLESFVYLLAAIVAVLIALLPIVLLLAIWLRRRLRFARRAGEALAISKLEDGMDVLALRALNSAAPDELRTVVARPAEAWRARDTAAIAGLARLELASAGVRLV